MIAPRTPVVTGMGAVSPLGMDLTQSWAAAREGRCALAQAEIAPEVGPEPFSVLIARVPGNPVPELEAKLGRKIGASLDPFAVYALGSAVEALADAGLEKSSLSNAAVVFGHGMGGLHTLEEACARFYGKRNARLHPTSVPRVMVSAPASAIAIEFGVKGPVFAVSSACASSGHAMAQAALLIKSGRVDVALVGGAEAIASPGCLAAWDALRAMSSVACRPFSKGRDGMAIGEGGACLVLESAEHAQARGAEVIAELAGVGMSSDAHHWTQPSIEGATSAMREACTEAGALEAEGMLISAHGTGTPLNDANEAAAIKALFGDRAASHHVIATKSAHGHLIGASTALQTALGLCALRDGVAPPILNYLDADPACDLNLVLETRAIAADTLLVNSFAFGGLNASLVFRRTAAGGARAR